MEHGATSIVSLMIVTGVAFFIPILLERLKLKVIPIVVAEIIAGIIIGQSGLNLIDVDNAWLTLLSSLGLIYLMFLSGLEIDFNSFRVKKGNNSGKSKEINPFLVSSTIFVFMLALAYGFSLILVSLGMIDDPYFMTIILSTISLGVVVPVLKERKVLNTKLGQTVLLIAVISDFVTMILFAYYLAVKDGDTTIVWWIILLVALVFMLYFILNFYRKKTNMALIDALKRGTAQIGTRGIFALILLFVALSETMGVENILGAFLAGVVVSLLSPDREFVHQLDSFGYGFLIPIFFVMVGVEFDFGSLLENRSILLLIPVVLIFLFLTRNLPTLLLKRWFSWNEVFSSGMLLTSTLSLAIVAATVSLQMGIISEGMNSAIVLVAILTCFTSPILYARILPEVEETERSLAIIGANRAALRASLNFQKSNYKVTIFSEKQGKLKSESDSEFPIIEMNNMTLEKLIEMNLFESFDGIIVATSNDNFNVEIANYANAIGYENIIIRIEEPTLNKQYTDMGLAIYSNAFAGEMVLKAMVHSPSLVRLLTDNDEIIREFVLDGMRYDRIPLRKLPFLGDTLILSIYRGERAITPNGDTILQQGDRLIISGSGDSMEKVAEYL
ncbi:monovalent cation:proton antiporter family protein [Oceanobacillus alkalisoli]|uniref:monovalent cation:proton antiporter family protein n=1 Tax=Oceanobacillus alkalisoli TaxID=2925113 RepID=UPI001EEFB025|nr:cation:proton antiporter family protein [Oceanobacillus alkalisoli]MCF3943677.1 cation:proton antiporter [Oceanobacillus alkalisoli]MCG5104090.1 cation:proton antiporter [Oceanobacillus alkalisoli]